jgi:hypothetical protein
MACAMPEASRPLPVLKVLFRKVKRILEKDGRKAEVPHLLPLSTLPDTANGGQTLLQAVRRKDMNAAEQTFAARAGQGGPEEALHQLLLTVRTPRRSAACGS